MKPRPLEDDRQIMDLTSMLVDHQLIERERRCTCGHRYKPGDSIRRHRAEVIFDAGWRPVTGLVR